MPKLGDAAEGVDVLDMHIDEAINSADDDADFNATDDSQAAATQSPEPAPSAQAPTPEPSGAGGAVRDTHAGTQQGSAPTQQAPTPHQQQTDDGQSFARPVRDDGKGNFVDPQSGQVIARAGAERRMFEKARKMEGELGNARTTIQRAAQEVNTLRSQVQQLQAQAQQPQAEHAYVSQAKQKNLSDREVQVAFDIVAQLRDNPVAGVQWVLQSAMAQGYNMEQLLGTTQDGAPNPALNMGAVRQMIDSAVKPLTEQQQREADARQQQQDAQTQYNNFVQTHQHADVHMEAIAQLCQRNSNLSPERAYFEIKSYAMQHQLDFSKPLGPQLAGRQQPPHGMQPPMTVEQYNQQFGQGQQPAQQQGGAPMQPNNPPIPQGGVNPDLTVQSHDSAGANDDWDNIISTSMREAGMRR